MSQVQRLFYTLVDKKEKQYIYIFARRHIERDCAKQTQTVHTHTYANTQTDTDISTRRRTYT